MKHAIAIFKKQLKDTLKNKAVLIQFMMFPIMTLIMNNAIQLNDLPENFFVLLFAAMYIGMAPLVVIAAIIAEEKEQNTLRVLLMSNVRPSAYLVGVGSYVWLLCMLGSVVICFAGSYDPKERIFFLLSMSIGIFASLLLGAAIGTFSKTQMMATSLTVPIMIFFSFLPMLSLFNKTVAKFAKYTYSEQIRLALSEIGDPHLSMERFCILAANMLLFGGLFLAAYKKASWRKECTTPTRPFPTPPL